jgi:hypothetical protein
MSLKASLRALRAGPAGPAPVRTFATEKQIAMRIVATSNLKKVPILFFFPYIIEFRRKDSLCWLSLNTDFS